MKPAYDSGALSLDLFGPLAQSNARIAREIDFTKRARTTDVDTSHEAARAAQAFGNKHHEQIVAALKRIGEGTFYDIARAADLTPQQAWRRMSELDEKLKLVERVLDAEGKPVTRRGDTGRQCCVWKLRS